MLRELTASEVTFRVEVEPEHIQIEGNVQCSDDPEQDRESEEWVRDQIDAGNEYAWCQVTVFAEWEGLQGRDDLGAVSCATKEDFDQLVQDHGMHANALVALNKTIQEQAKKFEALQQ